MKAALSKTLYLSASSKAVAAAFSTSAEFSGTPVEFNTVEFNAVNTSRIFSPSSAALGLTKVLLYCARKRVWGSPSTASSGTGAMPVAFAAVALSHLAVSRPHTANSFPTGAR